MDVLIVVVISCLLLVILAVKNRMSRSTKGVKIPGPVRWPLLDNAGYFMYKGCVQKASAGYLDAYGDTVECWLNGERMITTCNPDWYRHVTLVNGKNYLTRFASPAILRYAMRNGAGIVFNPDEGDWNGHRKIFKRFVATIVGPDASKIVSKNVMKLIQRWNEFPVDKMTTNITEDMHSLSLDLTAELAFGIELNTVLGRESELAKGIKKGITAWMDSFHHFLLYPPYWEFFPAWFVRATRRVLLASRLIHDLGHLGDLESEIFEKAKVEGTTSSSFLGSLSDKLSENEGDYWLQQGVLQDIREMLAGGSDTSANTLAYTIYFVTKHPKVEEKLLLEIDAKFDPSRAKESVDNMPYLACVIKEALRLLPPGSLILRKAAEDDYFGDYFVPKGTNVLLNLWYTFTSPRYWKDPLQFIPERFEGQVDFDPKFIPFGYGRRGCPGKPLAELELRIVLATIWKYYRMELVAPKDLHPKWGLVEHCEDITMVLHPRNAQG